MVSQNARIPFEILLVEDNSGDVRLIEEAFKENKMPYRLSVAMDGVEALNFLNRKGKYVEAPRPDIILLDLNLPKKNGREVLAEIKKKSSLRRIPVVVLTVSKSEDDIIKCYDLHANCYITKPVDFDRFVEIVKLTRSFWLTVVKLSPDSKK